MPKIEFTTMVMIQDNLTGKEDQIFMRTEEEM